MAGLASSIGWMFRHRRYGRGAGVGRGLGVGLVLGVLKRNVQLKSTGGPQLKAPAGI